jgi:hypothetical protein
MQIASTGICLILLTMIPRDAASEPLESKFREENAIWLTGPYVDDTDLLRNEEEPGNAMVCGMKFRTSTLSIRMLPDAGSAELASAPYYAIMHLTGELTADRSWAKVNAFSIDFTTDGLQLDDALLSDKKVEGWVSTGYLCNFVD